MFMLISVSLYLIVTTIISTYLPFNNKYAIYDNFVSFVLYTKGNLSITTFYFYSDYYPNTLTQILQILYKF